MNNGGWNLESATTVKGKADGTKVTVQATHHNHCLAACIPEGVRITTNMLGHVEKLRYSDHDVTDTDKFPEFAKQVYLQTVGIGPFGEPINQPVQWAAGLAKNGILGLLDLPHFGRGQYANNCVKQLMAVTHGGYLWLEQLVSIDVELITYITGLPSRGEDPMHSSLRKKQRRKHWPRK
jgi:hypothetical protein